MWPEALATYRIQINRDFDFAAAAAVVPYLHDLGIDFLYCSPCFQAAPNSVSGYDIVDYSRANAEWGGDEGFRQLCATAKDYGLRVMLDVVPNHMATSGRENPWWWDVLENGPSSAYANFFDVDWEPPEQRLRNLVLLPVLGDQYGVVLERGKLKVAREGGSFVIGYEDRLFPVAPRSLQFLLREAAQLSHNETLASLADAFGELPSPAVTEASSIARRQRDKRVLAAVLERLLRENPEVRRAVDESIASFNADPDRLDEFLEHQNYRLAFWKMAARDLGYRRFFDINSLAALRIEDDKVFIATHAAVRQWVSQGLVDALRVDHPDGMRDPAGYFKRLRAACPRTWIVAEKILGPGERLRSDWPIEGTTGYDFLNLVGGLLVDARGREPLSRVYAEFIQEESDFGAIARAAKQVAMHDGLGSDLNRLAALFLDVCESDRRHRDHSRHDLHQALGAVAACFKVYRSYMRSPESIDPSDRAEICAAIAAAKKYFPELDPALLDFLRSVLLLRVPREFARELALRFQQFCAAVMAKGVEDTAFYRFNRLLALNEVGGDPAKFGVSVDEFASWCRQTRDLSPASLLATSTHDTKRSEDVRARLFVLSEIPEVWGRTIAEWSGLIAKTAGSNLIDRNLEYHLYQVLAGAWPIDRERMLKYAEKAAREAKVHTSWTNPNAKYEQAMGQFINCIYAAPEVVGAIESFVASIADAGRINSLAQTLLKITAPGVPDFYQGCELWSFVLVDPDNRRPVDFTVRRALLDQIKNAGNDAPPPVRDDGLAKLWLIRQGLALRRSHPECFGPDGAFELLPVEGAQRDHLIAYVRGGKVIAIAPRLVMQLRDGWFDAKVRLPEGHWHNHLTGEAMVGAADPAELFRRFPVALLVCEEWD